LEWQFFNESEMAVPSECRDQYAQKVFDTADIVREAMLRQLTHSSGADTLSGNIGTAPFEG
jgi:hypothetical protein